MKHNISNERGFAMPAMFLAVVIGLIGALPLINKDDSKVNTEDVVIPDKQTEPPSSHLDEIKSVWKLH